MTKIRIFTLAKELNMDSKLLLEYCHRLGIELKNSALASITPDERDRVLALIKQGTSTAPTKAEVPVPVREARVVGTKVPVIKVPPVAEREVAPPAAEPEPVEEEVEVVAEEPAETVAPPTAPESAAPEPAAPVAPVVPARPVHTKPAPLKRMGPPPAMPVPRKPAATVAPASPAPVEPAPEETPDIAAETPDVITAPAPETAAPAPVPAPSPFAPAAQVQPSRLVRPSQPVPQTTAPPAAPPKPISREDYMPKSGAGGRGSQTMTARGSPPPLGGDGGRNKLAKGKVPPRPVLAEMPVMPTKQVEKPVVETAQKPEIRFPAASINAEKPLGAQLKKILQQGSSPARKAGETGDEFEEGSKAKGKGGAKGAPAAGGSLLGDRERRKLGRTKTRGDEEDEGMSRGNRFSGRGGRRAPAVALKTSAIIEPPITIRSLSEALGRQASLLVGSLMRKGTMVTINSAIDEESAIELAMELGVDLQIKHERDIEEELESTVATGTKVRRPPIVTILGHVDHGKTTLLDKIRSANVAAGEQGGITQHIAAYQVEHEGQKITFLDTPGHAAFAEMRARGANVTDIAVLVVAANDGVMPQTIEALNHARAANVPVIVAMNKVDLPDRNEQRVLQDLAGQNLLAAEWGGDTEVVRTSGQTGQGIEDLLATLLTIAELNEYTADVDRPARGVCLEAFRDEGRGAIAWIIVQDGTLRKGDVVLCGSAFGRIRGIYDDHDNELDEAPPSTPVKVAGLDIVPSAGDKFYVTEGLEDARQAAELRRQKGREKDLAERGGKPRTLEDIVNEAKEGAVQGLPVIIKADSPGSAEALKGELNKFSHPEVRVNILHDGVGGVNESDVYLAAASGAIIIAFHVVPDDRAQLLADREEVEIRQYGIIYEVSDDIKLALEGLLKPEVVEVPTGRAVVLQIFEISRFGKIAGCRVLNGTIERSSRMRVIRDLRTLNDYNIQSLRRNKDDVKEVREGMECGIRLEHFDDVKEGDILQAFKLDHIKRKL